MRRSSGGEISYAVSGAAAKPSHGEMLQRRTASSC